MPRQTLQAPYTHLTQVMDHWAEHRPDALALAFLDDGEAIGQQLTFAQFRRRYLGVAERLGAHAAGRQVIVACDPGLDFMVGFFGALAAGAVVVPVSMPARRAGLEAFLRVARDAGAEQILTTSLLIRRLAPLASDAGLRQNLGELIAIDQVEGCESQPPMRRGGEEPCLIQYTSGSTSRPKGVVLSHQQVLANQAMIQQAFGHDTETTKFVSWLPQFHDMGLIGNMLQPLYLGCSSVFFSPLHFLQRPARWLEAISTYQATTSGAPNFAYDLCTDRVPDAALAKLDLRTWRVAYNGAEPVRAQTMRRFAERFRRAGFDPRAFLPCYGLAEATLLVTGWRHDEAPQAVAFDALALEEGHAVVADQADSARELVNLGRVDGQNAVRIVDPASGRECTAQTVGEIWINGAAVGLGYHNDAELTIERFAAQIASDAPAVDDRRYLRSGDLGFVMDGSLYFSGRLRDVIVLRGKNYFPQDIELSAAVSLGLGPQSRAAAFIDDRGDLPHVILVQEWRSVALAPEASREIKETVTEAVTSAHQIRLGTILLVPRGSIPITTSGKVRRSACRELYLKGQFHEC